MKALWALVLVGLVAGCATVTPLELVEARTVYARLEASSAPVLVPTEFYAAKRQLTFAEELYRELGDVPEVRDHGYLALRKAQLAELGWRTERDRLRAAELSAEAARLRARQTPPTGAEQSDRARRGRRAPPAADRP